jgi:hypothetical protein
LADHGAGAFRTTQFDQSTRAMRRKRQSGKSRSLNGGSSAIDASLSVVVLSNGSPAATLRAASAVCDRCADLTAQLIVVSHGEPDHTLSSLLRRNGADLVAAPATSTRAEMCDLAMHHATGAIVTVREAADVGDGRWLDVFRTVVPSREIQPLLVREKVVLDTMVASGSRGVDGSSVPAPVDLPLAAATSLEMAATM